MERLWLNNTYIPLTSSLNVALTKSITDIEDPSNRKATYSKTVTLPLTKELKIVIDAIYEINAVSNFDLTVKTPMRYEVHGETILDGYAQVKVISRVDQKDDEVEIVLFGGAANIFKDMGEKYMNDTDIVTIMDEWNHPFTKEIQQKSWATEVWNADSASFISFAYGTGYVYPLADYGYSTDLVNFAYHQLPCCVYLKEYIDAIFAAHSYSYSSAFFDSAYFKKLVIEGSPETYQLTNAEILDLQFSANTPNFTSTAGTTSNNLPNNSYSAVDTIISTVEIADPSSLYNNATGEYTVISTAFAGVFDINFLCDIAATFTPSTGTAVTTTADIRGYLLVFVNGVQVQGKPFYITSDEPTFISGARSTTASPTYPDSDYMATAYWSAAAGLQTPRPGENVPNRYLLTANGIQLYNGDVVTIRWSAGLFGKLDVFNQPTNNHFVDAASNPYSGTATISMSVGAFYNKALNTYPQEGGTMLIEKLIPKQVKQRDFFMSIVKMFNLWIDTDPDDPKKYLIEPRDTFLGTTIVRCQDKLDQSQPYTLTPMGKFIREYKFSYKEDKDELNTRYTTSWQKVYGERTLTNENEFVTNSKEVKVIFSPTPLSAPPNSSRVLSTIIQLDNLGAAKPINHNIRIWYYGGLKSGTPWNHTSQMQGWPYLPLTDTYTTYPYAGHFDDPFTVTEDINFGLVDEVYYDDNYQPIVISNNNLVNKYYGQQLQAYNSPNSKIFEGWFNVSPSDFKEWTFSKLYHFENAFWRLQEITNYNPTGDELTQCTFLYLEDVPAFGYTSEDGDGGQLPIDPFPTGGSAVDFIEGTPTKGNKASTNLDGNSYNMRTAEVSGTGNYVAVDSKYVTIKGDSNTVESECENVTIQGDSNYVTAGLKNVTLINTSGVTVTESDISYVNGKIEGYWESKSADFTSDSEIEGYFIDANANDVTVTLDGLTEWTFKRLDSNAATYNLTIDGDTYNIDGAATITLSDLESVKIKFDLVSGEYKVIT